MKQLVVTPQINLPDVRIEIGRKEMAVAMATYRARHKMTQKQLAEACGCSRYTIIKAEKGESINWLIAYRIYDYISRHQDDLFV